MHLTLKFISDVESSDIGDISSVVGNQVKDELPFSLQLGKLGVFPGSRNPKVLWLGIEGQTQQLKIIQKDIDLSLQWIGYSSDDQLYSPHVTDQG
jgi:2'-5' RNA ligase